MKRAEWAENRVSKWSDVESVESKVKLEAKELKDS